MTIDLRNHHFEGSVFMKNPLYLTPSQRRDHKIQLWNRFVDSGLIGITDEDCGILPRILPLSYFQEIKRSAYLISLFSMKLLNLPTRELKAIIPSGPIRDFLIDEMEILKHRPERLIGSFRFDMALVGPPEKGNPPKLLEINEIGFGGLSRSTFIQNTMLELLPGLGKNNLIFDAAEAEVRNYLRLGRKAARFQYDAYDWEEEVLIEVAKRRGVQIKLVSPSRLGFSYDSEEYPLLQTEAISFPRGKVSVGPDFKPEFLQMGYSFELQDYLRAPEMYHKIVRSQTPQYSPFLTGLVASKAILVLLDDKKLRRQFLGSSKALDKTLLHAEFLTGKREAVLAHPSDYVLKQVDGLGGERVFFDEKLTKQLNQISPDEESQWVLQERTKLNVLELEGTLSRKRKVISDLGVFVQYDWSKGRFKHFEIGGFITRATNKTYKVNVSEGGLQIPVFFDRAA